MDFGLIIIFIIILIICGCYYYYNSTNDLKCVISTVDGDIYCVKDRDVTQTQKAVDLLANVSGQCNRFIEELSRKYPNDKRIIQLKKNFNIEKLSETLPNSSHVAFTQNKGQQTSVCLSKNSPTDTQLIDIDLLKFVILHECAHISTFSIGHTQEFWDNFKFLLQNAKEMGFYYPVNYRQKPEVFCGLEINSNPLYDM
jgi:hypothetical protein